MFLGYRVQYVTSVKLGFATVGNVSAHMPVPVLLLMLSVWSVSEVSGTMVSDYIQAMNFTVSKGWLWNILDALFIWVARGLWESTFLWFNLAVFIVAFTRAKTTVSFWCNSEVNCLTSLNCYLWLLEIEIYHVSLVGFVF